MQFYKQKFNVEIKCECKCHKDSEWIPLTAEEFKEIINKSQKNIKVTKAELVNVKKPVTKFHLS